MSLLLKGRRSGKSFSSFTALAAVLGGNLGTGNIAGIAVALTTGGPGSLFWMIVMVLFGSIIKYCSCFLGVTCRVKDHTGEWVGGPMYYLSQKLNHKYLAALFAWLCIISATITGNFVQINSITLPLHAAKVAPISVAIVIAAVTAAVMFGGLKRFIMLVNKIVPFMALFYILACVLVLLLNHQQIWPSIQLIWQGARQPHSIYSAGMAFSLSQIMQVGFDRAIFATDTGIGIAAILHAKVYDKSQSNQVAIEQGLISTLAPLIVLIVCLLTGMVLLVTGVWQQPNLESTKMCLAAFKIGLHHGNGALWVVLVTLCLFAFTTLLTWGCCAESAVTYLTKEPHRKKWLNIFKVMFIAAIPLGVYFEVKFLWILADLFLNLMLVINLYALWRLIDIIPHKIEMKQIHKLG